MVYAQEPELSRNKQEPLGLNTWWAAHSYKKLIYFGPYLCETYNVNTLQHNHILEPWIKYPRSFLIGLIHLLGCWWESSRSPLCSPCGQTSPSRAWRSASQVVGPAVPLAGSLGTSYTSTAHKQPVIIATHNATRRKPGYFLHIFSTQTTSYHSNTQCHSQDAWVLLTHLQLTNNQLS